MCGTEASPIASSLALLLAAVSISASCTAASPADETSRTTVPKYGVYEVTLRSREELANPFWDAQARADFVSPSGKGISVEGFYYGQDQWRVRFVPREEGQWRYKATLTSPGGTHETSGEFLCQGVNGHGFLRLSKANPFRMEYEDGTPFYPIGVETSGFLQPDFDGPMPGGGNEWRSTSPEEWAEAFDGAVNLVRVAVEDLLLPPPGREPTTVPGTRRARQINLDRYPTDVAAEMDRILAIQRSHGMSEMLTLFADMSLWGDAQGPFGHIRDLKNVKSLEAPNLAVQEKYIRYVVARFACFPDIWEIFNEDSFAPDDYLAHLADVIRRANPYQHLITTNYARPNADWCQIVTWHDYMGMPVNDVDVYLAGQIGMYKSFGKVVQNTEFGNQGPLGNIDPIKWRVATWTAFMNESGLVFWGMSGRKWPAGTIKADGGNANAYLGPDSRQYFRVLNDFTKCLPIDLRPAATGWTRHDEIRQYALSDGKVTVLYVHHFRDYSKAYALRGPLYVQTGPGRFRVRWIDPADGREIASEEVDTSQVYSKLTMPPVVIDIAARLDRIGPPVPHSR
jgi:hypothetical protein